MSNNINAQGRAQLAGIAQVFFIEHGQVATWPRVRAGQLVGTWQLHAGSSFAQLVGTMYTPGLDTEGTDSQHGTSYNQVLEGFYAGTSPEAASLFDRMNGRRYLVVLRYFNGTMVAVGNNITGLLFTSKYTSARKAGERKGYTWHFEAPTSTPAAYLTAAIDVEGIGTVTPGQGVPAGPQGTSVPIYTRRGRFLGTALPGQRITITSDFFVTINIS